MLYRVYIKPTVHSDANGDLVLLIVYTKAKFANLPAATLLQLKEAFNG